MNISLFILSHINRFGYVKDGISTHANTAFFSVSPL